MIYIRIAFWNAVYRESSCRARYLGHAVVTSKKLKKDQTHHFKSIFHVWKALNVLNNEFSILEYCNILWHPNFRIF